MKDPYMLNNGTLKNLLSIENYDELEEAQKNIAFVKLMNIEETTKRKFSTKSIQEIHKHIFGDVYKWAGEFRTVPIYKEEIVIPGLSLEYEKPKKIKSSLDEILASMNKINWKELKLDEISKNFTQYLGKIWRTHPFRDGNTRTTITFAQLYAKEHGFNMDLTTMLEELSRKINPESGEVIQYSIRDKFVLATIDENPEPEQLQAVIKRSIEYGINNKIQDLKRITQNEEKMEK